MTNLDIIKAEISSILEEYKQRFPINSAIEPKIKSAKIIISTSNILRTPTEIKSDLSYDMHEAMNRHIKLYGNNDEPEIIKYIKTCDLSFEEFLNVIH